ncbi:hypothetical protein Dip518_000068 [Parelusimicrobium proximum]
MLCLIIVLSAQALFAQARYNDDPVVSPVRLSLMGIVYDNDIPDSIPIKVDVVKGLDIGLIGTSTAVTYGVQIAGISTNPSTVYKTTGVQIGGLMATGDVTGIHIAGFAGVADVKGISVTPLKYISTTGLNLSLGTVASTHGLDISLVKVSKENSSGLSVNALSFNEEEMRGLQIGVYNYAASVEGVQLGIINHTKNLKGLQIGVANFAANGFSEFLPLVNFKF